jgi:hypothetical protein
LQRGRLVIATTAAVENERHQHDAADNAPAIKAM